MDARHRAEEAPPVTRTGLICIVCPIGCELAAVHDGSHVIEVTGGRCKRGREYAEAEIFRPERIVTTTVRIEGAAVPLAPVRTSRPVARDVVNQVLRCAAELTCRAPARAGDVLVEDVAGSGADLVLTRTFEPAS